MIPYRIDIPYMRPARATLWLIVINVVAFFVQWRVSEGTFNSLLTQPLDLKPWQWLTSAFMHANILHLGGNMLFLWVYGRYVEERLGPWRYVILYLVLALASSMVYVAASSDGMPALGASGAISGLMGLVITAAPRAKVDVIWWWFMLVYRFKLPAIIVLGMWVIEQMFIAGNPYSGIAVSAHLGGFFAGIAIALLLRMPSFQRSGWWFGERVDDALDADQRRNRRYAEVEKVALKHKYERAAFDKYSRKPAATPERKGDAWPRGQKRLYDNFGKRE